MEMMEKEGIAFAAAPWPLRPDCPTLVLVHGSAMSKLFWQAQIEGLSAAFNVLAPDLPGHGDSPGRGHDNMAGYGEAVMAWLEALDPPRPVPCGLSLGGAVVLYLLIHYPDRFPAGILINTGARLRVLPLIFDAIRGNFEDFVGLSHLGGVAAVNQSPAMAEKIRAVMRCAPEVAIRDFTACDTFDVMARLPEIKAPVLILSGSQDTTTPPKYAAYLAQHIAGARLVAIPDAAHLASLEQPQIVNQTMADFLRRAAFP